MKPCVFKESSAFHAPISLEEFHHKGWDFVFSKSIIMKSTELDKIASKLKLQNIPEIVFDRNICQISNKTLDFLLEYSPFDSLELCNFEARKQFLLETPTKSTKLNHISILPSEIQVKHAEIWKNKKPLENTQIKVLEKISDCFYSSPYKGTIHELSSWSKGTIHEFESSSKGAIHEVDASSKGPIHEKNDSESKNPSTHEKNDSESKVTIHEKNDSKGTIHEVDSESKGTIHEKNDSKGTTHEGDSESKVYIHEENDSKGTIHEGDSESKVYIHEKNASKGTIHEGDSESKVYIHEKNDSKGTGFSAYLETTEEEIPIGNLKENNPIIWANVINLWEDELGDNGISNCEFRFRVMNDCFFGLLRHYLRVDDVMIRIYDTRIYHEFGRNYMIREFTVKEDTYEALKEKGFKFTPQWMTDPGQSFGVADFVKVCKNFKEKIYFC